jgi:hypothetical protein
MEYRIQFDWDAEAGVWIATSEDVPGLVLESGSIDALNERVRYAVPELLKLNNLQAGGVLNFHLDRRERLYS